MKKLLALASAAILCFAPLPANAWLAQVPASGPPAYTGPGDVVTSGWVSWSGWRAFSAAIAAAGTQKLGNVTRASDSHSCDFIVATSGGVGLSANCSSGGDNGETLAAWSASTTLTVNTKYDQTGNSADYTSGGGNQPTLTISCNVTALPCTSSTTDTHNLTIATISAVSTPYTVSAVSERTGTNGLFQQIWHGGGTGNSSEQVGYTSSANTIFIGGNEISASATDGTQHVINGVLNGSSSVLNIDGTETTGTTSASGTSTTWCIMEYNCSGAAGLIGDISEIGVNSTALSSGNRTALCHNQRIYYGISGSC